MPQIDMEGTPDLAAEEQEAAKIQAAKAELYDEATQETEAEPQEFLGGKYNSVQEMEEGYKNLQREVERLRTGRQEEYEASQEEAEEEGDEEESEEQGHDLTSEEEGRVYDSLVSQAGGEERLQGTLQWMADNLPESRRESWNAALQSADESRLLSELKGIQYDRMMQTGYEPKLTRGRAPTNEVRGFATEAQAVEAMSDPRYRDKPDPAYIKEVEQRIAVSDIFTPRGR